MISNDNLMNMDLRQFKTRFGYRIDAGLGDDLFIMELKRSSLEDIDILRYPMRFDGYIAIFCVHGHITIDMNLNEFELSDNTLLIISPGNIFHVHNLENRENTHFLVFVMSPVFLSDMRFDIKKMFSESLNIFSNPCVKIEGKALELCEKYIDILSFVLSDDSLPNRKESISSLVTSLFYIMVGTWREKLTSSRPVTPVKSGRSKLIFERFIHLVAEYHDEERKVAFYADKLILTPKYLSKLVKQVSGRSAPEWIDEFVVLESKNLLKYSDLSIKDIVSRLHFPNQSVFYKFFKAHTGMTPSEYRYS